MWRSGVYQPDRDFEGCGPPRNPLPERQGQRHVCLWAEQEEGSYWQTGCDHAFTLMDGSPQDNGMKFCPYCGGHLIEDMV